MTKRGIISIALILLAFVIGFTTPTGFTLGDKVLLAIGIPPWSNGQTGFHYTILITFVLLFASLIEAKKVITGRRLVALILLCIFFTSWTTSLTKSLYYLGN